MRRWSARGVIAVVMFVVMMTTFVVAPYAYYRERYTHNKRFRVVAEGILYRSGQLTADGLKDVVARYGIRTVINLQNEEPDPPLLEGTTESRFCEALGVRYVFIPPDLVPRRYVPHKRPSAIEAFLAVMDDPDNHPVLLHCRAGLHRTGVLAAVYRMEYDGWTARQALDELKANGFGDSKAIASNDYIMQYILTYVRRPDRHRPSFAVPTAATRGSESGRFVSDSWHDPH